MAVIYTISHPLTNYVVYVGCSRNLPARRNTHISSKTDSPISKWIQDLCSQYMLPKIEAIENIDDDVALFFEGYWIQQFTQWGFVLMNKYKTFKIKTPKFHVPKHLKERVEPPSKYVRKTPEYWEEKRRLKREALLKYRQEKESRKKWNSGSFEIGRVFEIELGKERSFKEMFRQYAAKFKKNVRLFIKSENGVSTGTIVEKQPKPQSNWEKVVVKSGRIRYYRIDRPRFVKKERIKKEPKIQRYNFKNAKIGDTYVVKSDKCNSFQNSFGMYRHLYPDLYWKKSIQEDGTFLYTIIALKSKSPYKLPIEIIQGISKEKGTLRHVCQKYGVSIATVSKYRKSPLNTPTHERERN